MAAIKFESAVVLLVVGIASSSIIAFATEYIVGDDYSWSAGVDYKGWAKDKTFYVGDVLVFNYNERYHTVVKVNGTGFAECQTSPNSGIFTSGNDEVTLTTPGNKWYICGVDDHCSSYEQKLKVTVYPKSMAPSMPHVTATLCPISSSCSLVLVNSDDSVSLSWVFNQLLRTLLIGVWDCRWHS